MTRSGHQKKTGFHATELVCAVKRAYQPRIEGEQLLGLGDTAQRISSHRNDLPLDGFHIGESC
jgi:hypothetical protein